MNSDFADYWRNHPDDPLQLRRTTLENLGVELAVGLQKLRQVDPDNFHENVEKIIAVASAMEQDSE